MGTLKLLPSTMKKNKGKGRATDNPTESSPLLGSSSRLDDAEDESPLANSHRLGISSKTRSIIFIIFLILFSLLLSGILFILLLAYSFKPSPSELDSMPKTAFRYTPPDHVSVIDINEDGILLNISLSCGIDYDLALGIKSSRDEEGKMMDEWTEGMRGFGAAWWEDLRRWIGREALGRLPKKAVSVSIPRGIIIYPYQQPKSLVSLSIPHPLSIPLIKDVPISSDSSWLQPISFTALARPIASTGDLLAFAQKAWLAGDVRIEMVVDKVQVELARKGKDRWWSSWVKMEKEDLSMMLQMPVPHLPGLPSPGNPLDLASLVNLRSYNIFSTPSQHPSNPTSLSLTALATVPNFLPNYNITLPFGLPFMITLPGVDGAPEEKMAQVITEPIVICCGKEIQLRINGVIVADLGVDSESNAEQSSENSTTPLSIFLQNYLNGIDNPIKVQGLSSIPSSLLDSIPIKRPTTPISPPPKWLLSTLPSLKLALIFPAPPHQNIIQSLTIEHMRISESRGKMRASGVVIAEILIPAQMARVDVDIFGVKPDVLVFDGPVTESLLSMPWDKDGKHVDGDTGNGEDYPAKAFGRIHPDDFLPSSTLPTVSDPNDPESQHGKGKRLTVRAPIQDIPLDILPSRDPVLRAFISKIVFKGGALAGISGIADVRVRVGGVRGKLELGGLPVTGEVWVGRGRLMGIDEDSR